MGTRADFYVGKGKDAEWCGSIAWDGYPGGGIPDQIADAKSEAEYREAIKAMAVDRDDWTSPEQGWPWPWDDSGTTDYAYTFADGSVWASCFGAKWVEREEWSIDEAFDRKPEAEFPNMASRKNVRMDEDPASL